MSVTLSPIYAHFSETLTGLATIRALRDEARFKQENEFRLETNQRANFCGKLRCTVYISRWVVLKKNHVIWRNKIDSGNNSFIVKIVREKGSGKAFGEEGRKVLEKL